MSVTYGFALKATDNAREFSQALQAIAGDGVTLQGGRFNLTVNGFTVALSSGYALAAGRWVESDEPLTMRINAAGNNEDRMDALVCRVDYEARKAALEVLVDVDPAAIQADPGIVRDGTQYVIVLYLIRVRRGATSLSPDDVTDLADNYNQERGLSAAQVRAMEGGCLHGWDSPAADPRTYGQAQGQPQQGGMTLA